MEGEILVSDFILIGISVAPATELLFKINFTLTKNIIFPD